MAHRLAFAQLLEHRRQRIRLIDPITLHADTRVQAMVFTTVHRHHLHVLLDRRNTRQETLAIEATGVKLFGRLIGGADHHHAFFEHHLEQTAKDNCITDVTDEQLVKTQHAHLWASSRASACNGSWVPVSWNERWCTQPMK